LCNDSTIVEERPTEAVTYVHMAFENHEVVYAEGVEAESFHPASRTLAGLSEPQRQELLELFPELGHENVDGFAYDSARPHVRGQEGRLLSVVSK